MAAEGEIEVEAGTEVETKGEDKTPEMLVILPSSLKTSSSVTSISSTTAASTGTPEHEEEWKHVTPVETAKVEVLKTAEVVDWLALFEIETVAGQNH